tara:strand:- start:17890 stop:18207 length:318 start_codon:yes stop_codon:yes gene_type:complete
MKYKEANILTHIEGLDEIYRLRREFEIELELSCLNSEFFDLTPLLSKALRLKKEYPDNIVLKESEFHDVDHPYYEISVFCNKKDLNIFKEILNDYNLSIDIIHEN